jgi:hypothetical protein
VRTVDREQLPGNIHHGVEDSRSEDALARVVVEPDDEKRRNRRLA